MTTGHMALGLVRQRSLGTVVMSACKTTRMISRTHVRTVFSHARMGVDPGMFLASEDDLQPDQSEFKERTRVAFTSSELKDTLIEDIHKFVTLSVTAADLGLAREMLASMASDETSQDSDLFLTFISACSLLGQPAEAIRAWQDPRLSHVVKASLHGESECYMATLVYMNMLLDCGMYDQLVDFFLEHEDHLEGHIKVTLLAVLACYKQGTEQALEQGIQILSNFVVKRPIPREKDRRSRMKDKLVIAVALHAYNLGDYSKAYSILERFGEEERFNSKVQKQQKRWGLLVQSLMMMSLAKGGHIHEAIGVLETFMPRKITMITRDGKIHSKRIVMFVAVETVVIAAKNSDEELLRKVMDIVGEIEKSANVYELTHEEMLFRKMQRKGSDKLPNDSQHHIFHTDNRNLTH